MKRYVVTTQYECVDTCEILPHLECYVVGKNNHLYAEQIDGYKIDLGLIIDEFDGEK